MTSTYYQLAVTIIITIFLARATAHAVSDTLLVAIAAGLDSGERPLQLRDLAAALRKSEDVNDKLRALKHLEGALLASPDELKHYAGKRVCPLVVSRCWNPKDAGILTKDTDIQHCLKPSLCTSTTCERLYMRISVFH